MSFILDALKKSESERQQQGAAEFAQVPVGRDSNRPPLWLWVLGILLVVNLAVLGGVLLRPAPGSDDAYMTRNVRACTARIRSRATEPGCTPV